MSRPSTRLIVVFDHDTMRDGYRHFLDASKRLADAIAKANAQGHIFPTDVMTDLDAAITDFMLAGDAFRDAEIGTLNTSIIRGIK